tara:strand:- start:103 stop:492 length:390 start_codon:yes stop_codon:yes gene_type:complete
VGYDHSKPLTLEPSEALLLGGLLRFDHIQALVDNDPHCLGHLSDSRCEAPIINAVRHFIIKRNVHLTLLFFRHTASLFRQLHFLSSAILLQIKCIVNIFLHFLQRAFTLLPQQGGSDGEEAYKKPKPNY